MIIKKIAKLAKEAHSLGIASMPIDDEYHQWMGGVWGIYDISDLPSMTFEQACVMFDYSKKQIDNIQECEGVVMTLANIAEEAYKYISYDANEIEVHSTFFGDEEVKVFVDKGQTTFAFIQADLFSPIPETGYTTKTLVKGRNDETYVFVHEGLQLVAVIPSLRIPQEMVKNWQKSQSAIYTCMSLYLRFLEDNDKSLAAEDEVQYTLNEYGTEGEEDAE